MEKRLTITDENVVDIISSTWRRFEASNPVPDSSPQSRVFIAWYRYALMTVGTALNGKIQANMDVLDGLFRRVYLPLSIRYGIVPSIADFSLFIGMDADTISSMANKPNTPAYTIYSGWMNIIKEFIIGNLSTESGSNINLIFVAKSIYGIHEEKNSDQTTISSRSKRSRDDIIAELGEE